MGPDVDTGGGRPTSLGVGHQRLHLELDLGGRPHVVIVQEGDPGLVGGNQAGVASGGGAAGRTQADHRYPCVRQSGQGLRGAVRGTVVNHNATHVGVSLVQHGPDGLQHKFSPVVARDDGRHGAKVDHGTRLGVPTRVTSNRPRRLSTCARIRRLWRSGRRVPSPRANARLAMASRCGRASLARRGGWRGHHRASPAPPRLVRLRSFDRGRPVAQQLARDTPAAAQPPRPARGTAWATTRTPNRARPTPAGGRHSSRPRAPGHIGTQNELEGQGHRAVAKARRMGI